VSTTAGQGRLHTHKATYSSLSHTDIITRHASADARVPDSSSATADGMCYFSSCPITHRLIDAALAHLHFAPAIAHRAAHTRSFDISQEPWIERTVFDYVSKPHPLERRILVRDRRVCFLCPDCCKWLGSHASDRDDLSLFREHYRSQQCRSETSLFHCAPASASRAPALGSSAPHSCPGVRLHWTSDIESDYLWHLHKPGITGRFPWTFPRWDTSSELWFVSSNKCQTFVTSIGPCSECAHIPWLVAVKLSAYIEKPSKHLSDIYRPLPGKATAPETDAVVDSTAETSAFRDEAAAHTPDAAHASESATAATKIVDHVFTETGRKVFKVSHINISFNSAQRHQSKERLERVEGFKSAALAIDETPGLVSSDEFAVGQLFATLMRYEDGAFLAVLECIEIRKANVSMLASCADPVVLAGCG
jgi:hypothetical protein